MSAAKKPQHSHVGHRQRLKDAALVSELEGMSSYQVLELLLFYTMPYKDTNAIAHNLLDTFGSLAAVFNADYQSLLEVPGVGPHAATLLTLMPSFFRRYLQDGTREKSSLITREQTVDYVKALFIGKQYEEFYMICLNNQYRVINAALLSKGSLSAVIVYPRIAVETALLHRAKHIILAHNHPGGRLQPSAEDLRLTRKIKVLLAELSIFVIDHIIVSGDRHFSFVEKGLLP